MLFTFPSRYWCTIGRPRVLSLGGWSPRVPTGFLVSRRTQVRSPRPPSPEPTGLSPAAAGAPTPFGPDSVCRARDCSLEACGPTTPSRHRLQAIPPRRFGLVPVRSPLLRESRLISSPPGTQMFQFPGFARYARYRDYESPRSRVSPFGHPWIIARSAAPQGLSWPPTSFVASGRLGIHRAPIPSCFVPSVLVSLSLKARVAIEPAPPKTKKP